MWYTANGESPAFAGPWTDLMVQALHSTGMHFSQHSDIRQENIPLLFP